LGAGNHCRPIPLHTGNGFSEGTIHSTLMPEQGMSAVSITVPTTSEDYESEESEEEEEHPLTRDELQVLRVLP
jgi:hypothetical protein